MSFFQSLDCAWNLIFWRIIVQIAGLIWNIFWWKSIIRPGDAQASERGVGFTADPRRCEQKQFTTWLKVILSMWRLWAKNIISKNYWHWDIINTELELAEQYLSVQTFPIEGQAVQWSSMSADGWPFLMIIWPLTSLSSQGVHPWPLQFRHVLSTSAHG